MWFRELTHEQRALYVRTLLGSHEREVSAHVLTYDGKLLRDVTDLLMPGGEITGDTSREVLQIADIALADPARTISFDHPTSVPVSRRRLVQIIDSRRVPGLGWVDVVVHTGPIWTWERDGDTVRLVVHDGSRLAMGTVRKRRSWSRKARITAVIVDLLSAAGADPDQIRVPKLRPTLARVVHVGHRPKRKHDGKKGSAKKRNRSRKFVADNQDTYWGEAQQLARALGRRLYASPELTFRLKSRGRRPALTVDLSDLLAPPAVARDDESPRPNMFEVRGRDPKGKKHHRPSATAVLPVSHEESRESLAWNGHPTEQRETTVNDHLKSKRACTREATKRRDRALRLPQRQEVVIPSMPFLRAWDLVQVRELGMVSMQRWRFPLSGAEGQTVGSTARVRALRGRR